MGIDAAQSSWRWRIARLQHRRVDAGRDRMPRRRHNPKKKPPEWHLSLLRQRPASDSNFRSVKEERFRLQRAWRTQAGTGCHEGGIILSKKPPEWHLFLPQQRSASDSNFLCGNREWFRLQRLLRQQRMVSPAVVVAATENGFAGYRYEVNRVRQCFRLPHRVWL